MGSFGYNWSNCKNLKLWGVGLQKMKLWCLNERTLSTLGEWGGGGGGTTIFSTYMLLNVVICCSTLSHASSWSLEVRIGVSGGDLGEAQ
jgi:hypothetical protein